MIISLADKTALVTGGGAGIGRAIAQTLAAAGAKVAVVDINLNAAEETADLVRKTGGEALALAGDMTDPAQVNAVVQALDELHIAVNNVGMMAGHPAVPFLDWTPQAMQDVVANNILATAFCCQAEAKGMKSGGSIVNISSGETTRPAPLMAPYGAAKAGVNHLTQTLAVELAPYGIRVNAAAPGTTLTHDVASSLSADYLTALRESIPLKALSEPQDLADLVLFLVSDLAAHTTGQFFLSDNGAFLSRSRPSLGSN